MERLTGLPGTAFALGSAGVRHPAWVEANARITFGTFDTATARTNAAYERDEPLPRNQRYPYGKPLVGDHAYVVTNVDVKTRMVTVRNPWDQKWDIRIPYDDLEKVFPAAQANPVKLEDPISGTPIYPTRR
jgi:hypothetical protein